MKRLAWMMMGLVLGTLLAVALVLRAEPRIRWSAAQFDLRSSSAEPPLDVAPLADIIAGAEDDAGAARLISAYYEAQREHLSDEFQEADDARLRALFGMYITHLAVPYGIVEHAPESLVEFASAPTAHCGTYADAQSRIYDALGVTWRRIHVDGGWHGLLEALIGRRYETFDATSNVWLDKSVGELLAGMERESRMFYSPIFDAQASDAYRAHLELGYSVPELRVGLPQWGILIFPAEWEVIGADENE